MTKQQLAEALAQALNVLNDLQSELEPSQQGPIHKLFASIPQDILEKADFANNGQLFGKDLTR